MNARRTNSDMFALGEWAGLAENDLNAAITGNDADATAVALKALLLALSEYKETRNLAGLETLQRHWEKAAGLEAKLPTGDSGDVK